MSRFLLVCLLPINDPARRVSEDGRRVVERQYGVLRHGLSKLTDPGVERFWFSGGEGGGTGRRLGLFKPHEEKTKKAREEERYKRFLIEVCGRAYKRLP